MAAVMGRTEIGVKAIGSTVKVPNDPRAKLMYYLNSMCSVLDLSDQQDLSRLIDYQNYYRLSEAETDALVSLCFLLSPDVLSDKVIFQSDEMCGNLSNKFYEVSAISRNLLVSDSIMIGGQTRRVSKVMFFKMQWLVTYWMDPMKHFAPRIARIAASGASAQRPAIQYTVPSSYAGSARSTSSDNDCCCVIL